MYDDNGNELFGHDGRHKPPRVDLLTARGWGDSRGRLAYSSMNRQQETNFSEYAINTLGCVPPNYVIVNARDVRYNPDTALKVGHGRVAIPVKEFAMQRRLSLKEQWELMNPRWVGTFFGHLGEDTWRNRRPNLERAMVDAMNADRFDEFMRQFWSATSDHADAIGRLNDRAKDLQKRADVLHEDYMVLQRKISRVESDIHYMRYEKYHLQGLNVHEYLDELKDQLSDIRWDYIEARDKAESIRQYLKRITFKA